jgi:hypothetical protein
VNRHQLPALVGVIALSATLLAAAVRVQAAREAAFPASDALDDAVYVTSGGALRRLTGAYNDLAADVYWVRAIQYYGGTKRRLGAAGQPAGGVPPPALAAVASKEYDQLYTLLDITTTLDPRFEIAYRFGAVFLAEAYPAGAGRSDLAVRLLEKGLREQPDKWEYMEDIGFVHYWYSHDFAQAAAWFNKASGVPDAPVWLKGLAATTLAQGGDRQSSRVMWESIRQSTDVDWMRATAERLLTQLAALDQIDMLQIGVDRFAQKSGAAVTDWRTLTRAGALGGIPLDPAGTPYELTSEGRVRLSQSSPLFPLPTEPGKIPPVR